MLDFILLIGTLAVLGIGCVIWRFRFDDSAAQTQGAPARRREDARNWQQRLCADALLAAHFLQPTQNEILETLYVLDHLWPGWETGNTDSAERLFLNELALGFPTLCKANCAFPLPFVEMRAGTWTPGGSLLSEATQATRREAFRLQRAHFNALEQLISDSPDPSEALLGDLKVHPSEAGSLRRVENVWSTRLAGVAVLLVATLGVVHFLSGVVNSAGSKSRFAQSAPIPEPLATEPTTEQPAATQTAAVVAPTPISPPVPAPASALAPVPAPALPTAASQEKADLTRRIAASKQRAVSKYPALAVEGSEINLRFVFRYKNLLRENSPRLLDPSWPEQLVEECAAASITSPKHSAFTKVIGMPR